MIYTVTIRTAWDAAPLKQGAAQSSSTFDQITKKAEDAAQRIFNAFDKTYGSLKRQQSEFAKNQSSGFDQAAKKAEEAARRAAQSTQRDALAAERAESRTARQRIAESNRAAREVERIHSQTRRQAEQNARLLEQAETRLANHRIREAERAQRAQSNALLSQIQAQRQSEATPGVGGAFFAAGGAIAGALGFTIAAAIGAITSALHRGGQAWLDYSSKIQNAKIAFTAMLGSSTLAEAHLKELQKFALQTPFRFDELVDASQRMQALGFGASEVVPILRDVGNAVAAAGGGGERLERVIKALADVRAKEKLQTQEIRQFAEAGISAYKILEEATGKSVSEIQKDVEAGRISAELFLDAFRKFSQVHFGDLMEQQSKTFAGAMSNIQDVLLQTAQKSFEPLFQKISEIAFRVQQELQKAKNLEEVSQVLSKAFLELGGFLAEQLVVGLSQKLSDPTFLLKIPLNSFRTLIGGVVKGAFSEVPSLLRDAVGKNIGDDAQSIFDFVFPNMEQQKSAALERIDELKKEIARRAGAGESMTRLFGIDRNNISIMTNLNNELKQATEHAKQLGAITEETAASADRQAEATTRQATAMRDYAKELFPALNGMEQVDSIQKVMGDSFSKTTDKVFNQAAAYKELNTTIKLYESQEQKLPEAEFQTAPEKLREYVQKLQDIIILETEAVRQAEKLTVSEARDRVILAREKTFKALDQQIKESTAALAGPGGAQKAYNDFIASLPPGVERAIRLTRSFEKAAESVNAITDKSKNSQTELQRLTKQFERLTADVDSFRNLGTAEFDLRFKTEALERVKSDFEKIITLRRDLGIQLSATLPEPTDTDAIRNVIRSLESQKRIRDGILQTAEKQIQAEERLKILQAEAKGQPVDVNTRIRLAAAQREIDSREAAAAATASLASATDALNERQAKHIALLDTELDKQNDIIAKRRLTADEALTTERARERVLSAGAKEGSQLRKSIYEAETVDRLKESNNIRERIIANEEFLKVGLISFEVELAGARSDANKKRVVDARATAVQIALLEDQIRRLLSSDKGERDTTIEQARQSLLQDRVRTLQQIQALRDPGLQALQQRVSLESEQADLEGRILQSQIDLATSPYNASLRIQAALLEDIIELRGRDEEAIIRENRAQLELADATVLHSQQVRAQVLEHLASQKSLTEAFGDGITNTYDKVIGLIDRGIDKLTGGLTIVNDLLKSIARQLLNRVFQRLLDSLFPPSGGTVRPTGAGFNLGFGGGQQGGALPALLGGFLRSGTPNIATPGFAGGPGAGAFSGAGVTNPQVAQTAALNALFSGGKNNATSLPFALTSQLAQQSFVAAGSSGGTWGDFGRSVGFPSATAAPGLLGRFGPMVGAIAPMLGLGLGAGLGGQSRLGSIVGGAGGLIAGGIGAAFLAPGLFAASGVFGSMGPAIAGLLTNPFTAVAAGALIVGALVLRRNAERRRNEQQRTESINDALAQLNEILRSVKADRLDGNTAIANALQIRSQYVDAMSKLSDRKTRDIALSDVSRLDIVIAQIRGAGDAQARRQKNLARIVPEFKTGAHFVAARGLVSIPGPFDRKDDVDFKVSRGETVAVMTPQQFAKIGGKGTFERAGIPSVPHIEQSTVRSFQTGGFFSSSSGHWSMTKAAEPMYQPLSSFDSNAEGGQPSLSLTTTPRPVVAPTFTSQPQMNGNQTQEMVFEISELVVYQDSGKAVARGVKSPEGYNAIVRIAKAVVRDRVD